METPYMNESYAKQESETDQRKRDHIDINLHRDVAHAMSAGLENYRFTHCALPNLNLDQIDTSAYIFGRKLHAPLLISSMTGGTEQAREINIRLADAAQGELANYEALEAKEIRYLIKEVTFLKVITQVTVYDHGKMLGRPARRMDVKDVDLLQRQADRVAAEPEALAERIVFVLRNPGLAADVAARAHEAAAEFIWPYDRPGQLQTLLACAGLAPTPPAPRD